ncbi:MAG TPA: glycosyl transferase [Clostridiaceae bacterium]|nr:glycosyl transferase [Clostridiaceae bacterium]
MDFIHAVIYLILICAAVYMARSNRNRKLENIEVTDAILGFEDAQKHAIEIGSRHVIKKSARFSGLFISRINKNYKYIREVYEKISAEFENDIPTIPAAEWLLDNFYIIEEQMTDIRRNLADKSYTKLPILKEGYLRGLPRIYAIALEMVVHNDGNLDEKNIISFIKAYQTQSLLSVAELWFLAFMIRIALIDMLRNICFHIMQTYEEKIKAEQLIKQLEQCLKQGEEHCISILTDYLKKVDNLRPAFVEHFFHKLRGKVKSTPKIIALFNEKLKDVNSSIEKITAMEHQNQAALKVTIGNTITSLKMISNMDWVEIFEALSQVEEILNEDPSGIYPQMDFESRDYYRSIVEKLAGKYNTSETLVARKVVECAAEVVDDENSGRKLNHIGFYLMDKNREYLEKKIGYKPGILDFVAKLIKKHPVATYIGIIILLTALIVKFLVDYSMNSYGGKSIVLQILTAIVLIIPASDLAVFSMNFAICSIIKPSILPKLNLKDGIPDEMSTMVIIPTLLPNGKRVKELLEQLEIHYLSNKEKNLYFALVGDFKDSSEKEEPEDQEIIKIAMEGVKRLNETYCKGDKEIFYYFNRERLYNKSQGRWMGWERKRGAVVELNELLLGSKNTSFKILSQDIEKLPKVKYVITLDADTNLPMGAAKRLIGTLAHPLNKAVVDDKKGVVVEGYGLLQPRIEVDIISANRTLFSRIFAGQGGIDPYTTAVSDVYQDFFKEGIFTGKGIYELEVFQKLLKDTIPENAVLSHDLLEGSYVRTGLVTDIQLIDGYPAKYNSYAMRMHRWVRGDWQLLPWLGTKVKNRWGEKVKNPLSPLSKWKIFDNLRRSMVHPSLLVLIILGLSILPGNSLVWLGFALLVISFPSLVHILRVFVLEDCLSSRRSMSTTAMSSMKAMFYQIVLQFSFMAYQAYLMLDAIIRTIARLMLTRKNMLEWVTAADMEARLKQDAASFWKRMWVSPLAALISIVVAGIYKPAFLWVAFIPTVFWIPAPYIAFIISGKYTRKTSKLEIQDIIQIRMLARKIWRFFEDMVTEEDNYLPPDNYQEDPPKGVAHRTSPTNIGLLLMSILTARDLGFISTLEMCERMDKTSNTIKKLEKWEGHLYNWYNTTNLDILRPGYISTVDSGNYVGYLMVTEEGLKEYLKRPLVDINHVFGIMDVVRLCNRERKDTGKGCFPEQIQEMLSPFFKKESIDLISWKNTLNQILDSIPQEGNNRRKKKSWTAKLTTMIRSFIEELNLLMPLLAIEPGEYSIDYPDIEEALSSCRKNICIEELSQAYKRLLQIIGEHNNLQEESGTETQNEATGHNLDELKRLALQGLEETEKVNGRIKELIETFRKEAEGVRFEPLFDSKRQLFAIGYNVDEGRLDKSHYDLFASEARQASYIAIARGEVDKKHWFRMGRRLAALDESRGLMSWTGTMFEYLMPLIIMKNFENTLLDATYKFVVKAQKAYGEKRKIPWGVSESAYYGFDRSLNYQYKAFGVPGLGLKRGLGNDMVVTPYASILAITIDPSAVISNIKMLASEGMEGTYGLYEAIDYTPSRISGNRKCNIVKSFMAHHQGMSLLAINNYLNNNILQARFHNKPIIRAAELLLHERIPARTVATKEYKDKYRPLKKIAKEDGIVIRKYGLPSSEVPNVHLLSNGDYTIMLTDGGCGYSKLGNIAVTRWREDFRSEGKGYFIYIQNLNSNTYWSATYEPCKTIPQSYRVEFLPDKAQYVRRDGNIETRTEVVVSTEDNTEIRCVSLTNFSKSSRTIEVTSYFEVVLDNLDSDVAHPAFSDLFITTEFIAEHNCLMASRRARSNSQDKRWIIHSVVTEGEIIGDLQYETDRMKFIGRNRNLMEPLAMGVDHPLSNTAGSVLHPIMSLRRRVKIEPGKTAKISFITATGKSREELLQINEKYKDWKNIERAYELAWTRSQIESRYLNFKYEEVELYLKMLPPLTFISPLRRKWADAIARNTKGQSGLWPFGISGDLPIVLMIVSDRDGIELAISLIKGTEYLRMKGINIDLVVLVEEEKSYNQPLLELTRDTLTSYRAEFFHHAEGLYILNASELNEEDKNLLYAAARIVFRGDEGPLKDQLAFSEPREAAPLLKSEDKEKKFRSKANGVTGDKAGSKAGNVAEKKAGNERYNETSSSTYKLNYDVNSLQLYNGYGGFEKDYKQYVIILDEKKRTPAPWINVISNSKFGFLISENGGGYTWSGNSRENRLTPWYNDPVTDTPGEIIYIRNEKNGKYWSSTPAPARGNGEYIIRHGWGFSSFHNITQGIEHKHTVYVSMDQSVKINHISLKNTTPQEMELSLMYYVRLVMGVNTRHSSPYIITEYDAEGDVLLAYNPYNTDFSGRVAFVASSEKQYSYTGDRGEFIGIGGSIEKPEALRREMLSRRVGAGFDPCLSTHVIVNLKPGEEKEIIFILGEAESKEKALMTAGNFKEVENARNEFNKVTNFWESVLGTVKVDTPEKSMNILLNGWLLYQVISCRLWGRSGFYQSGGAYGFRDQLQDVMALSYIMPQATRAQILLHASRQYIEGDVQHWWHMEAGKGIRTRYSDDFLWLPFVTAEYIAATEDWGILEEEIQYLESDPLEEEDERYEVPRISTEKGTLYQHCIKAIERGIRFGEHGIPLMGSGDWNDGMNTVGNKGRGESIWLGWFLYTVITKFINICNYKGDTELSERYAGIADNIAKSVEEHGWDGGWYRRAYFDDGKPLGSAGNSECKIDAIAQAWSVISRAGRKNRTEEAMQAVENYLVDRENGLIKLLTPPFGDGDLQPGYIKGYVPGVRENGGQYTHAAIWVVMAYAMLGMGDKATDLFYMINPINHARTPLEAARYRVEPYVMAADVYAVTPNIGRGGWTWYTGAAGWMFRLGFEVLLGIKIRGNKILFDPCIPRNWPGYKVEYRYKDTLYIIKVNNPDGVNKGVKNIKLDGVVQKSRYVPLENNGGSHLIEITM